MLKKLFIAFVVLFVIGTITLVVAWYPNFKMPPESKEVLDAKLAEYQPIVTAMRSRPVQDREALGAIVAEMKKQNIEKEELRLDSCPHYTTEFLEGKKPVINKIAAYEDRVASILDDGLVIQYEGHLMSVRPDYKLLRMVVYQQLASAVISNEAGEKEQVLNRLGNAEKIIRGFVKVPSLAFVLGGFAVETSLHETIVFLLPSLGEEEIKTLRESISALPEMRKVSLDAIKAETVATVDMVDHIGQGTAIPGYIKGENRGIDDTVDDFHVIAKWRWYYSRERAMFLSIATREIEALEGWLAAGGKGEPPSVNPEAKHSLVALITWPFTKRLMTKMGKRMQERSALLEAMDAELKRRTADPKPEVDLPYGNDAKIVLKSDYGCIIKNDSAAAKK